MGAGSGIWNPAKPLAFCLFSCCLPPALPTCPAAGAVVTAGIVLAPSAWPWVVAEPGSTLGSAVWAPSAGKEGKRGRNGRWILLWGWGEAGYSCLTEGFGCYCTWLTGERGETGGLFSFADKGIMYLSPWLFFSVRWLLQSFDETAKIISFGIHCSDLSRNRIHQIHKEAFTTVGAIVNL